MTQEKVEKSGVIIFDLDGCVINDSHRLHLIDESKEGFAKYEKYHAAMKLDSVLAKGKEYLDDAVSHRLFVAFVTARPVSLQTETTLQIEELFGLRVGTDFSLFMRPIGDLRSSPDLKSEIGKGLIEWAKSLGAQIAGAFDDRQDVVDAYAAIGIPAFLLDESGSDAPLLSALNNDPLSKFRGIPQPTSVDPDVVDADLITPASADMGLLDFNPADGPVQPQTLRPEYGLPFDIGNVLKSAAATFDDRAAVYGRNDLMYGQIMAILFPNGLLATEPDEHRKAMFVMHIVGKLTRFAASGFSDKDSIHDVVTYAAMAEASIDANITPTIS